MNRSIKNFILFTLIAVLPLAGLGCKGPDQALVVQQKQVQLNYWTVYNDVPTLQKFAQAYKKQRPYVTINIRQVRYQEFDQLFTNSLADDVGPDIVSMHTRWLPKYQSRLSPMPPSVSVTDITVQGQYAKETIVTEVRNAMPSLKTISNTYVATVPNDVALGGQVYGLPLALDTMVVYYNKDLLDRAGVALPPTTWQEFTDAVKKSTKYDARGEIVQSGVALGTGQNIDNAPDILALLLLQNKVDVTNSRAVAFAGGISETNNLRNHPTVAALKFYTDFANPATDFYTWNAKMGNALDEFVRGKSVFYFGFAYDGQRIRERAPQMNMEVIPVPQLYPDQSVNVANYWVESVVKKSKNQNEAWDFIRFMSQPENIEAYTVATQHPTPLRAQIAAQKDKPELAPFADSVLRAKNWYTGRDVDAAGAALRGLIQDFSAPYGDNEDADKRDANLILNAARVVQQTM